jgi:hypothetical protein
MATETPMIYDEDILTLAARYAETADKVAGILNLDAYGISFTGINAPILEEYNDRNESLYEQATQWSADVYSYLFLGDHDSILGNYESLSTWEPDARAAASKISYPVLIDIGPGNIQLFTAIRLLNDYNDVYPDSDPLDLKQYNSDYAKLGEDLRNIMSPATVKIAGLMVKEAMVWGETHVANWHLLTSAEKEAFASYYYNVGQDYMNRKYEAAVLGIDGRPIPGIYTVDLDNTPIAQEYLMNRDNIIAAQNTADPYLLVTQRLIADDYYARINSAWAIATATDTGSGFILDGFYFPGDPAQAQDSALHWEIVDGHLVYYHEMEVAGLPGEADYQRYGVRQTLDVDLGDGVASAAASYDVETDTLDIYDTETGALLRQYWRDAAGTMQLRIHHDDGAVVERTATADDISMAKEYYVWPASEEGGTTLYLDENGLPVRAESFLYDGLLEDGFTSTFALAHTDYFDSSGALTRRVTVERFNTDNAALTVETLYENGVAVDRHVKSITYNGNVIPAGEIGAVFGSQLGLAIGGDDLFASIATATVLETLLENVGQLLQNSYEINLLAETDPALSTPLGDAVEITFEDFGAELIDNLAGQINDLVSSLIAAELADAIGLEGVAADIATIAGATVTSQILSNLGQVVESGAPLTAEALFAGLDAAALGPQIATMMGSYFGGRLGGEVIEAESQEGAIGGSIGAAIGSLIGKIVFSAIPFVGTFIGSFIGKVVGTWIGDLFGDEEHPQAYAKVHFNAETGNFEIYQTGKEDGGSRSFAEALAENAISTAEAIVDSIGATIDPLHGADDWKFGHYENTGYAKTLDEQQMLRLSVKADDTPARLVEFGVSGLIRELQVIGGNPVLRRAFYASREGDLDTLIFNLSIAQNFVLYLENTGLINALIVAEPTSEFAAGWIVTLQLAEELGLNRASASDFLGGFAPLLEQLGLAGQFTATPDFDGASLVLHPDDAAEAIVTAEDFFGPGANRKFAGTQSADAIDIEAVMQTEGLAADALYTVVHVDGSAGDDTIHGHAGSDLLIGGDGNDIIDGRAGADWITGGNGEDLLSGGAGDDLVYGGAGDDNVSGGTGEDFLIGGAGDDIYRIGLSEGFDIIDNTLNNGINDTDTIAFQFAYGVASMELERQGSDLLFSMGDAGTDAVLVREFFGAGFVDRITYTDGVSWSADDLIDKMITNDDTRYVRFDSDTFIFTDLSSGTDVIDDFEDGIDRLDFGDRFAFDDLAIEQVGNDTLLMVDDPKFGMPSITLNGFEAALFSADDLVA